MTRLSIPYIWLTGPYVNQLYWDEMMGHPLPWILRHGLVLPTDSAPDVYSLAEEKVQLQSNLRRYLLSGSMENRSIPYDISLPDCMSDSCIILSDRLMDQIIDTSDAVSSHSVKVPVKSLRAHGWQYELPEDPTSLLLYESLSRATRGSSLDDEEILERLCKRFPVDVSDWNLWACLPPYILSGPTMEARPKIRRDGGATRLIFAKDAIFESENGRTDLTMDQLFESPIVDFHGFLVSTSIFQVIEEKLDTIARFGLHPFPIEVVCQGA